MVKKLSLLALESISKVVELTVYLPITEHFVPELLLTYSIVVILLEELEDCRYMLKLCNG